MLTFSSARIYQNVALRGKATQSDRYDSDFGAAYNAIDGNRESDYAAGSCAVTELQTNPWWRVDLLNTYIVTSITVTNRRDCCPERLDGAEIHVGSSLINNGDDNPVVAVLPHIPAGRSLTINFSSRVQGRYVSVVLPGTGRLLTICEVEVYGYYAPTANVALRGRATQSDTVDFRGGASNAIDGNRDSVYSHSSCTQTSRQTSPWWRVDLLKPYILTSITITNRGDCCQERLDGAEIRLGNTTQNNNPIVAAVSHIPAGVSADIPFHGRVAGRYVSIVLPGSGRVLSLCEVEVYGYQAPTGENLALKGKASQSSINHNGIAYNAIDGSRQSSFDLGSCMHTDWENSPWWRLDLGKTHRIFSVM
ncbi:hypothetical protein WMY93_024409 [Mugilogobius chulae]|uniref:Fucolectin tachylectin-4 pentraxin-1 domain-containing protein n=1 Tax=Mugilogobius chulae TaxID=88201 RepID=A0AAW0N3X2_9GOBI